MRRLDATHLEADLGNGCRVRLDQSPEPNDHNASVSVQPEQQCPIAVPGFTGTVPLSGTAMFGRGDPRTLNLSLVGNTQQGDSQRAGFLTVRWGYDFDGQVAAAP